MRGWTTLILLAAATPALAAPPTPRWTPAGRDAAGRMIEIDRASLTWRPVQRAWWRVALPRARPDGAVEERHLELIDCDDGVSAVIQTVSLDAGGAVLRNQEDGEALASQRLRPPTPGTTGEMVAEVACRMRPPPPPRRRR